MVEKIVSGGQTGVDRAALDVALELKIPCGGWCPAGRRAEDGPVPAHYPLVEAPSVDYRQRTEWNVRDSDGTLVLTRGRPTGGTRFTLRMALRWHKPRLVVDLNKDVDIAAIKEWIAKNQILILNVAGSREGEMPGIATHAATILRQLLADVTP
jgi:Circularly permutated YpsA SLOG family